MAQNFWTHTVTDARMLSASAARAFSLITDWSAFPEWNPYITRIEGDTQPGSIIRVFIFVGLGPRLPLTCTVEVMNPQTFTLAWTWQAFPSWLYRARHSFQMEAIQPDQCRIVQSEVIQGLMACPLLRFFHRLLKQRFEEMHRALLARLRSQVA